MATPVAHSRRTPDDRELARLATAGDGRAFAELYDRHERRVYGFCVRMLGSPHDAADATQETFVRMLARLPALEGRELNFAAYALGAARNACYDMIEGRKRVEPVAEESDRPGIGGLVPRDGDLARDPERSALLAATMEEVQAANAELPPRQREVLTLREVERLSYDEIGEIMGLNRNAVAQLVSRARLKLRDLLRGGALASVSASSADCERALPLLAGVQDEQPGAAAERAWLRDHLAGCETCRLSRAAMQEAGVSYRALAPLVPLVWLRHATIARAAEFVGADWSAVAGTGPGTPGSSGGQGAGGGRHNPTGGHDTGGGAGATGEQPPGQSAVAASVEAPNQLGVRRRMALAAGVLLTLFLLLVALVGATHDGRLRLGSAVGITAHSTSGAISAAKAHHVALRRATHARAPVLPGSSAASAVPGALATQAPPERRASRVKLGNRRPRRTRTTHRPPPSHAPLPAPVTTPQATTPQATTPQTTPTPPPPATTTAPPTQTTPAPPTTGSGESTGTRSTPREPPPGPAPPGFVP